MIPPAVPNVQSNVEVETSDSCNCRCCFGFPSRKKRQRVHEVSQTDVKITEISTKVRRDSD